MLAILRFLFFFSDGMLKLKGMTIYHLAWLILLFVPVDFKLSSSYILFDFTN